MAEAPPDSNIPSGSMLRGSDSDFDNICQPCGYEGKNLEAVGYCLDCCAYLCSSCFRYHNNLAITRHHKLQDADQMPTEPDSAKVKDVCTERCQSHEDEIVKYFCPAHKVLGCSVCVTLKHKLCEDVEYIPEVSKDIENSDDYKAFQTRLEALVKKSEEIIKTSTESTSALTENYTRILQDVEAYKTEVIQRLSELENEIKRRIEEIKYSQSERMTSINDIGTGVLEELRSISARFEVLTNKKQHCQMFTDVKHSEKKLSDLKDKLQEIEGRRSTVFIFQAGAELRTVIKKRGALGSIVKRESADIELSHVADVDVRTRNDKRECYISGATVLSEQKLVLADYNNNKIKMCDTVNNTILSELKPETYARDVTTVSKDIVAATLPSTEKVVFVRCRDTLAIDREIKVNGKCQGIDCAQGRLFVSYTNPAKTEILSMSGEVLKSFATNDQGDQLFVNPYYICVSASNQSIYVSDWGMSAVIQLNMDGHVLAEYKDGELTVPCEMAVDGSGLVYLCSERSDNIHLMSPQGRRVKILLGEKDGLKRPESICYLEARDRLYIGMCNQDCVKVYQLK